MSKGWCDLFFKGSANAALDSDRLYNYKIDLKKRYLFLKAGGSSRHSFYANQQRSNQR